MFQTMADTGIPRDLSNVDVASLIPHRAPFLLLDRLGSYVPGTSLSAVKAVTDDEFWAAGHFPGSPVMPGVLVTEALAQTCAAFMALESDDEDASQDMYVLLRTNVRYPKPVLPGSQLTLSVTLEHASSSLYMFKVKATVGEAVCVRGELSVGLAAKDKIVTDET